MRQKTTRRLVMMALLVSISSVLMLFEIGLPFMPPFLKIDISTVPLLIGSFAYGPLAGVLMSGVKSFVAVLHTSTAGIGELADFLISTAFTVTSGLIYKYNRKRRGAVIGLVTGIFAITLVGALTNLYLLLPLYEKMMPMEAIIAMCAKVNPSISDIKGYILMGVVPFNLIKGTVNGVLTFLLYKRIAGIMHRFA